MAAVVATILNVYRDPARRQPWAPDDLMPGLDFHRPPDPMDEAMRIKALFDGIAAAQERQKGDA